MNLPELSAVDRDALQAWFRRQGRDLPWRRTRDPYAILVSEFMLQQTQVQTVVPFYQRWMKRFPTTQCLAAADEEEVLRHWQGLGYYARARSLHRLVRQVVSELEGRFPQTAPDWRALPGIGPYTAAALMAFAFDEPAAVVDANVARVLTRWANYRSPIDTATGRQWLEEAACSLQPCAGEAAAWNSAVMELGSLVCRSGPPDCLLCPVKNACRGRGENPAILPVKKKRPVVTAVTERRALWIDRGHLRAELSPGPRWRGLYILPLCSDPGTAPRYELSYSITRYRVRLLVHHFSRVAPVLLSSRAGLREVPVKGWADLPWATPHRRAVACGLELVHSEGND